MPSNYAHNANQDFMRGAGFLYINGDPWGVSDGEFTFDPGTEWENTPFADKGYKLRGLDERLGGDPKISGTLIQWTAATAARLEPGSTSQVLGGNTVVTPKPAFTYLSTGDYVELVAVYFPKVSGGFRGVQFDRGLVTTWRLRGRSRGKALIELEIEARLDQSGDPSTDRVPYSILDDVPALP